ncbi:MAG: hypothetical protein ACI841_004274 [Planctomycetota bacterium]|jgi:hypothetical protein
MLETRDHNQATSVIGKRVASHVPTLLKPGEKFEEKTGRRGLGQWWRNSCLLFGLTLGASCAIPGPKPEEMLKVGFRTPLQAFESFRLAVRGELKELEYRCWSFDFTERNRLGQMTYREVRDEMMYAQGVFGRAVMGRALWKAEVIEVIPNGQDRARVRARYRSHTLWVDLVREDFWELWGGPKRLDDSGEMRWEDLTASGPDQYDQPVFQGVVPLKSFDIENQITELRIGREWKLDGFGVEDDS